MLAAAPEVALDTEGDSLHHYPERLALVQVATPQAVWVVDPLAVTDLTPLAPVFSATHPLIVVHAGDNWFTSRTLVTPCWCSASVTDSAITCIAGQPE